MPEIEKLAAWLALVIACAGGIASWLIIRHKQDEQTRINREVQAELDNHDKEITELKHQHAVANAKREDMLRVLQENSKDVKHILQKITELSTLISVANKKSD